MADPAHSTSTSSTQLYELLVSELTGFAVFLLDLDGRNTTWNPGIERMLGYAESEWIGQPFSVIFTPEDRAAQLPELELAKAAADGRTADFRWHQRKDGSRLAVQGVLTALKDGAGKLFGYSKWMRDVTADEDELKRQWRLFDTALSQTPDLTYVLDLDGRFTYANRALLQMFGRTFSEVAGKTFLQLGYPPQLAEKHHLQIERVISTRQPLRYENPFIDRTGTTRHFEHTFVPVFGADGEVEAVAGSTRDTTGRQRADQEREQLNRALDRRAAELEAILASMPDALYIGNESGITHANQLALDQLGFLSVDELRDNIARLAERIQTREPASGTRLRPEDEPFARAIRGETVAREVATTHLQTGEEVIVRCSAGPIRLDGLILGAVAINTDITAQKRAEAVLARQAEELKRSNSDLQQFAYAASHDLQEPLRTMINHSQLVLRRYSEQLGPDAQESLGFVISAARRMKELTDSLLTYSRVLNLDALPLAPVRLDAAVHWATMNLQAVIQETSACITTDELPVATADQVQLVQVFQNLIGNAIKYRRAEESPRVHIGAVREGNHWTVCVRDNGMGIPPEHRQQIFGVFKRLHGYEISGTGMGLAIVKRIVERHGGRIWVGSEPGVGSTFFFTLPAA